MPFDSIYMLTQAANATGHRVADVRECVESVLSLVLDRVMDESIRQQTFVESDMGVHTLNGLMGLFAVAQGYLGTDEVLTDRPLRLVLKKRPYI